MEPAVLGSLDEFQERHGAIALVGVRMELGMDVVDRHEPGVAAHVIEWAELTQLRLGPLQPKGFVQLGLGPGRDGGLAVLRSIDAVIREQAVLIQPQAALLRATPQEDIVFLAAREVEQRRTEGLFRHDAKVDLESILHADAGLRLTGHQHLRHTRQGAEGLHRTRRIRCHGDEVDVADGLLAAPKAACELDPGHHARGAEVLHRGFGHRQRVIDPHTTDRGLQELDAVTEILDLLGSEARQAGETVLGERRLQRREVDDSTLLPQQPDGLGADTRQRQQGRQAGGDLRAQVGQILDRARHDEFDDLRGTARADPIDGRQCLGVGPRELHEVDRRRLGSARDLGVRQHPEGVGPGEFEQDGELLEQSHDVGVAHGILLT